MTYQEARAQKEQFQAHYDEAAAALRRVEGIGTGPMGLTPSTVRATQAFRNAYQAYALARDNLQSFNAWFPNCILYKRSFILYTLTA